MNALKLHPCCFFLTVAFHLFLMMAYAQAETLNKIRFSIIVAILFAIRICSNSLHFLRKRNWNVIVLVSLLLLDSPI